MSNDSRVRDRNAFQEVMRLANASTPAKPSSGDKEDSGLIDLEALAAGDASGKANAKSHPDRTPPGTREDEWSREGAHASAQPSTPPMSSSGVKTKQALGAALVTAPSTARGPQWLPSTPMQRTERLIGDPSTAWRPPPSRDQDPSEPNASAAGLPPETTRPTSMVASVEQAPRAKSASTVWVALVGGVGVGALAAVLAFKIHSGSLASWLHAPSAAPETVNAGPKASPPAAAGVIGAASSEWKNVDVPGYANAQGGASASQASQASVSVHPAAGSSIHALAGVTHDGANSKGAAPAEPAEAPPQPMPKPAPVAAPAPDPTSQDKLVAMMQKAVRAETPQGPAPAAQSPASAPAALTQANPGNLPARPAAGAIMGALGTVMPAARYCLGPDDPVSRATITFKSDGSVENVVIVGDAAAQPAASCIKARLMEAKVPPFSSSRFTWTVPVRPAN